jgi:exodeoxyribonuclease VII large subunit
MQHLHQVEARVRLLDPVHAMARGWSLTRTVDGRIVRSAAELRVGDEVVSVFADGEARSRVEATTHHPADSMADPTTGTGS